MFGIIEKGLTKEKRLMKKFGIIFMFGVIFTIFMLLQGVVISVKLFYVVEVIELGIVFFLIRHFVRSEIKEDKKGWKKKPKRKVGRLKWRTNED